MLTLENSLGVVAPLRARTSLLPEDFLHLADFALHLAADLLRSAFIFCPRIACRTSELLFHCALRFGRTPFHPIFRARFHTLTSCARAHKDAHARKRTTNGVANAIE